MMDDLTTIFLSNRVENLYEELRDRLFDPSLPIFHRRQIIVPSPAMKTWLTFRLANDPRVGIAAGIQFSYLDSAVRALGQEMGTDVHRLPSRLEISIALETEIRILIEESASIHDPIWAPLWNYLQIDPSTPKLAKIKAKRRLVGLTDHLAHLFRHYGLYAGKMLQEWRSSAPNWQAALWQRIYRRREWIEENSYVRQILHSAATLQNGGSNRQIHLFAMSFLPKLYCHFFESLSHHLPLYFYIFSPCQEFWTDLRSDREIKSLQKRMKHRGSTSREVRELEGYLFDSNRLLANLGRVGREYAFCLQERDLMTCEMYQLPESTSLTLLELVQSDILAMRNPDSEGPLECQNDCSIQVHVAHSIFREVEILYDRLLHLILKSAEEEDPILPSDVIVMAPDILNYAAAIKNIFQSPESKLEIHMMDMEIGSQSIFVQGFLALLELAASRWESSALFQLVDHPAFQRKMKFSSEDAQTLREWVQATKVFWGVDPQHRDVLLKNAHCVRDIQQQSDAGTWEYGFHRLLSGLVMTFPDEAISQQYQLDSLPLAGVETTQSELIGKFFEMIRSLKSDLQPLIDGTQLPLSDWGAYLSSLLNAYFEPDPEKRSDKDDHAFLEKSFDKIGSAAKASEEALFDFITVRYHLNKLFQEELTSFQENCAQAIRFCAMLPMRAIPAKVIVLLGMQEGAFPRAENNKSLNLMNLIPGHDYCPTRTDFDRYLFLEALLSARKYFLVSYQGYEGSNEQSPSLLVTELLSYLSKSSGLSQELLEERIFYRHPALPFDGRYFDPEELRLKSYSWNHYQNAVAYHHQPKYPSHRFLLKTKPREVDLLDQERVVDLKFLSLAARNPVKLHLQESMGIYLPDDANEELDEPFVLSALDRWNLRKKALSIPVEKLCYWADRNGILPSGHLRSLALAQIHSDVSQQNEYLEALQIAPQKIFSIEFVLNCRIPQQIDEALWQLPPIQIPVPDQPPFYLIGKLDRATPSGWLSLNDRSVKNMIKEWPSYLAYCLAIPSIEPAAEKELLFLKDGKTFQLNQSPENLLLHWIRHAFLCLETCAPLMPEWIKDLCSDKSSSLMENDLRKTLTDKHQPIHSPHLKWILDGDEPIYAQEFFEHWIPYAKELFSPILQQEER